MSELLPTFEEIVILPPSVSERDSLALISDTQFLEPLASSSLNRKNFGIVSAGVFRGFKVEPNGGLELVIRYNQNQNGDQVPFGVATAEHNDYLLTIRQQHDIVLPVPSIGQFHLVLEATYEEGVVTKQVSTNSDVDAAVIKLVDSDNLLDKHVELCFIDIPEEITELTTNHLVFSGRAGGGYGIDEHVNQTDPHTQYVYKHGGDTGAAGIPTGPTSKRPAGRFGLWRFNEDAGMPEYYDGNQWKTVAGQNHGDFGAKSVWSYEFTDVVGQITFPIELSINSHVEVCLNGLELPNSKYHVYGNSLTLIDTTLDLPEDMLTITVFQLLSTYIVTEEYTNALGQQVFDIAYNAGDFIKVTKNGKRLAFSQFQLVDGGVDILLPLETADDVLVVTALSQNVIDGGVF